MIHSQKVQEGETEKEKENETTLLWKCPMKDQCGNRPSHGLWTPGHLMMT